MGQASLVEVAVAAIETIANGSGINRRVSTNSAWPSRTILPKALSGSSLSAGGTIAGRLGAWDLQLGLIFHGDGRGDGIADGRKQQGWQQCSHGFTCAWLDVAKYSAIALTSSSVMALATPTIS